jgi:hypothetical protein
MSEKKHDGSREERIAHAMQAYYRQGQDMPLLATDLLAWYRSLAPSDQAHVHALGPYHWAVLPTFKRYVLEQRGYSLVAYLQSHLTASDFAYWLAQQTGLSP